MSHFRKLLHGAQMTASNKKDQQMTFVYPYGKKRRVQLDFKGSPSLTQQSFKDECDINTIMRRYQATGLIDHVRRDIPQFQDVTGYDFHEAMNLVSEARALFLDLPSSVRERFSNDPGQFLDFVNNPANAEEMVKMGLATRSSLPATPVATTPPIASPAGSTQAPAGSAGPSSVGPASGSSPASPGS